MAESRGEVDDDVAGEGVASDVADQGDVVGGGGCLYVVCPGVFGGEVVLEFGAQDGAVFTAATIARAVAADEDDGVEE